MIQIYKAPSNVPMPSSPFSDPNWRESEEKYLKSLAELLKKRDSNEHVGKIVKFPHADGYAMYMVASMKPVKLVWLEIGDAWEYPYIERLTKQDILDKIKGDEAMAKLFSK